MDMVLLVDDDAQLNEHNRTYLCKEGYDVICALTKEEAIQALMKYPIDIIVLDVMLPQSDGFSLCRECKKISDVPVIFLSNLDNELDMEKGFISGGIDYMYKPYKISELALRIKMRLRQYKLGIGESQSLEFGVLQILIEERLVLLQGKRLALTASEFDILVLLAKHPGAIYTIAQIYELIWKMPDIEYAQTVQVHIAHLRKKMEGAYAAHAFIQTVWGKGYTFQP